MSEQNDFDVKTVVLMIFCVLAGVGGGFSLKEVISQIAGWQALVYAVGAGIFIALSTVLFNLVLSSCDE